MTPPLDRKKIRSASGETHSGREIFTISALNEAARDALERSLGTVWVEGEISNIARPASGHIYFSLKDAQAQVRCAMFRNRTRGLSFLPENGLSVIANGRVSLYTARGDYQLIVDSLEAAGDGLLRMRFEQLKRQLHNEGLFEPADKQPLPAWPRRIGVITSPTGAAVRDIVTVLGRRCPSLPIIIYPTAVQGAGAAAELEAALALANQRAECDVLIVGRGGGSLEDLWSFNEERVARAIHASALPVISAVGHEIDITIADLVADVRAATPSAAAELVSPDGHEASLQFAQLERRLVAVGERELQRRTRELKQLSARLISPQRRLETNYQRVDELSQRLNHATGIQLRLNRGRLTAAHTRLAARSPQAALKMLNSRLQHARSRLQSSIRHALGRHQQTLSGYMQVLTAMGPTATLERGYAIVTTEDGKLVKNSAALAVGQSINTRLAQGRIVSQVSATENEPPQSES